MLLFIFKTFLYRRIEGTKGENIMKKCKNKIGIIFVGLLCLLYGCSAEEISDYGKGQKAYVSSEKQQGKEEITLDEIDLYKENCYVELYGNQPNFTKGECTLETFESYSRLDHLGRCGVAYANICQELMPREDRGKIGMVKPSGWHTVKYDCVDGKYLYNRCHLIGYQLAGENANEKNLITGTRYMNVEGMLPFENEVADYVEATNNHVLYRVTPVFSGDNLIADGVEMEAYSVEDEGQGVCFHVFVYNIQPGIGIDYATGESWEDSSVVVSSEQKTNHSINPTQKKIENCDTQIECYVLNSNTKKFHKVDCNSVRDISKNNKREYSGTRQEVLNMGYEPCKRCNP